MTSRALVVLAAVAAVLVGSSFPAVRAQSASADAPTYTRDVAPILYKNCTGCHRPGEIGPMALLTYSDVRPRVRAISTRVSAGTMPPPSMEANSSPHRYSHDAAPRSCAKATGSAIRPRLFERSVGVSNPAMR